MITRPTPARTTERQITSALSRGPALRRISVVGGAGYLGSVLVPRLLDRGYQVTVMDALMYGDDSLRHVAGHPGLHVIRGDLRDIEAVVLTCAHSDAVVHLGAIVGDPACAIDEDATLAINRDATATLARAARALGVRRFVFASTCSIYGASEDVLTEESPIAPLSVYARSKAESEQLLLPMATKDFAPTVLRLGTLYGHSYRERFDLVVNFLVAKALIDGEITVTGGDQWRPFLHVDDAATAVIRCLLAPEGLVRGSVYNVGTDAHNLRLRDLAAHIAALVPTARVVIAPAAAVEASYHVSFARIEADLGVVATTPLSDGLAQLKAVVQAGLDGGYLDARYSNVSALRTGIATLDLSGARVPVPST